MSHSSLRSFITINISCITTDGLERSDNGVAINTPGFNHEPLKGPSCCGLQLNIHLRTLSYLLSAELKNIILVYNPPISVISFGGDHTLTS